jgi:hypothetical protein
VQVGFCAGVRAPCCAGVWEPCCAGFRDPVSHAGAGKQTQREQLTKKDTVQVVEIGLHPVTNPLLSSTASTVCHRTRGSSGSEHRLVLRQGQDRGNLSSYEEI